MSRAIPITALSLLACALPTVAAYPQSAPSRPADGDMAQRLPISAFADTPFFSGPVISPDGRRIAGRATAGDSSRVVVIGIDDKSIKSVALKNMTVAAIAWAGSDRLLLTMRTQLTLFGLTLPRLSLYALDVATSAHRRLDAASTGLLGGDVLYTSPAGDWALVSSQDHLFASPSVKRIDLATGVATTIEKARPNVWDWFADAKGVVRAGIAYTGSRWTIWYRDTPEAALKPFRGRQRDDEGAVDGIRFVTGSDTGLIVTNTKTGRFAAYDLDLATGAIGAPLFEHADVDISGILADPQSGRITGVSYTDDRFRIAWLDDDNRQLQARIDKALPGRENIINSRSSDGNRVLFWSGSASDPGTFYVLDRSGRQMIPIATPFSELPAAKLREVEPITYAARDGLTIHGYLTLPATPRTTALPLVVLPHGGPFMRDTWDFDPYVQFLANRGYAVLQPNFRGSTGYGKEFVERGYGQWGRAMQDDVDDGVDWLVRRGTVDPRRVCIMGASYGGYAALWGAIRNPERYRCAVSIAGVTDLNDMLAYDKKAFAAPRYFREWQKKVAGEKKGDLDLVSPLAQAARLTVPTLIAHGEKDDNVPVRQAHRMVEALDARGFAVEHVFYADEGHSFSKRENITDFLKRLEAFLAKHNPTTRNPAP